MWNLRHFPGLIYLDDVRDMLVELLAPRREYEFIVWLGKMESCR